MPEETLRTPTTVAGDAPTETKRLRSRRRLLSVFGAGALLSAASLTQAVGNFAFHIVSTRMLGPAEYARLGALLNLVLFVGVPLAAFRLAATISVARARSHPNNKRNGEDLSSLQRRLRTISGAAFIGLIAASPAIDTFFKIHELHSTLLIAPFIAASVLVAGWQGVAIGRGQNRQAALSILSAPVLRLGIGIPLLLAGGGVVAAMIATVAGELGTLITLRRAVRTSPGGVKVRFDLGSAGTAAVMLTGLWLFSGVDVFIAVRILDAASAGEYLAIAGLARTAMMVPQIFATVGVRHWSAHKPAGDPTHSMTVRRLVWAWLGVAAVGSVVFALTAEWWVHLLFGAENSTPDGPATATLLIAGAAVSGVATISSFYFKARSSRLAQLPWVGAAATTATLIVIAAGGGAGETTLALSRLVVVAAGAAALFALAARHERRWLAAPSDTAAGEPAPNESRRRVLHVIGEYIYQEGMGRTIDRVAENYGDEYGSDVVCAVAHSRGHNIETFHEMGGSPATLMLKHRHLRELADGYDLVHFHGGTFALLAAARMASHKPTAVTVYGAATIPSRGERRLAGWRSLRRSNVLTPRVVLFAIIPTWLQAAAVRRVGVAFTHDQQWAEKMADRVEERHAPRLLRPGARQDLELAAGWKAAEPEIIFVGRSEKVRGIEVLLDAYRQVRQTRPDAKLTLHLLATAEADELVEAASSQPGVAVHLEPLEDTEARLAQAQVGVWPYLADYTTSPPALTPVEALSVGLPVVGTKVACLAGVLDGGAVGGEVEPGDADGLARTILGLIGDSGKWAAAAEASRAASRGYGWDTYNDAILYGYASALDGGVEGEEVEAAVLYEPGAEVVG